MEIHRESGRHTRTLPRSKGERRAAAERRLRAVEWLRWPRIWILPERLRSSATVSSQPVPWVTELAALAPGLYAVGPAPDSARAIPPSSAENENEPWSVYRRKTFASIHPLRVTQIDAETLRETGSMAESSRRFPKMFPELVGDPETWREQVVARIGGARKLLEAGERVDRWDSAGAADLAKAAVPLTTNLEHRTVYLAAPPGGPSSLVIDPVIQALSATTGNAGEIRASLAAFTRAKVPALSESLFLAWLFSGGTEQAVRAALRDLTASIAELDTNWNGAIPDGVDPRAARRLVRARQPMRAAWIGAVQGLSGGSHFFYGIWLMATEGVPFPEEQGHSSLDAWHNRCQEIEQIGLRLAVGLGGREQCVLQTLLAVYPQFSYGPDVPANDSKIDLGLALARAGIDAETLREHTYWFDLADGLRANPSRLQRALRHRWFGPELGESWDSEVLVSLEERLFDWILELPSRMVAVREEGKPLPKCRRESPEQHVIEQVVEFLTSFGESKERQKFFCQRSRAVGNEIVRRWAKVPPKPSEKNQDEWIWARRVRWALTLAFFWDGFGFDCEETLFGRLLDSLRVPECDPEVSFIAVALCGGSVRRLLDLVTHLKLPDDVEAEDIRRAWAAVEVCPDVHRALVAQPPSKMAETIARVADIGLLSEFSAGSLRKLLDEGPGDIPPHPSFAGLREALPEREADIVRLQWLQEEAGLEIGPSRALRRAVERSASDRKRLTRQLDSTLRTRELERIRGLIRQVLRAKLAEWTGEEIPEALVLEEPWRHAILLGSKLQENRRSMKRLLRAECGADSSAWIEEHPANVHFLERLERAGGNREAWLAGFSKRLTIGEVPLEIHTEDRPLEVLRMGTLFGTCLSKGDINAHAAVANAVDLNKRVVYVRHRGKIEGRKLIGVVFTPGEDGKTERAVLVGYAVYGSLPSERGQGTPRTRQELVQAVDSCCVAWATNCGIDAATVPDSHPEMLVTPEWYHDQQVEWNQAEPGDGPPSRRSHARGRSRLSPSP